MDPIQVEDVRTEAVVTITQEGDSTASSTAAAELAASMTVVAENLPDEYRVAQPVSYVNARRKQCTVQCSHPRPAGKLQLQYGSMAPVRPLSCPMACLVASRAGLCAGPDQPI